MSAEQKKTRTLAIDYGEVSASNALARSVDIVLSITTVKNKQPQVVVVKNKYGAPFTFEISDADLDVPERALEELRDGENNR